MYEWFHAHGKSAALEEYDDDPVYTQACCDYALTEIIGYTQSRQNSDEVKKWVNEVLD